MKNTVYILRPHPMMVERMTAFLAEHDFNAVVFEQTLTPEKVADLPLPSLVVVSTTAVSDCGLSLKDGIRLALASWPDTPLVLTTAVEPEKARAALEDILCTLPGTPGVRLPGEPVPARRHGLLIHKPWLESAEGREKISEALSLYQ